MHVRGSSGHEGLIQAIRPAYEEFKNEIYITRPNFMPFSEDELENHDMTIERCRKEWESEAEVNQEQMDLNDVRDCVRRCV